MPEDRFRFKRFTVRHDRCAMKVTTEACLFGAWLASQDLSPRRMLDIGCGSGLLMLMLAQSFDCPVDGIELDPDACGQCQENLSASPWQERLKADQGDAASLRPPHAYDLILSNPPFHSKALKSGNRRTDMARHDETLTLPRLAHAVGDMLSDDGTFAVWLPCKRAEEMEDILEAKGWSISKRVRVSVRRGAAAFRTLLLWEKTKHSATEEEEMYIREADGDYSERFKGLLAPYYLAL